jgi:hypothetical protein
MKALFLGTEVVKMITQQNHPFNTISPKIIFAVFREWMHYFGAPMLQIWFRTKCMHFTPLDKK